MENYIGFVICMKISSILAQPKLCSSISWEVMPKRRRLLGGGCYSQGPSICRQAVSRLSFILTLWFSLFYLTYIPRPWYWWICGMMARKNGRTTHEGGNLRDGRKREEVKGDKEVKWIEVSTLSRIQRVVLYKFFTNWVRKSRWLRSWGRFNRAHMNTALLDIILRFF